ncbi:hypothetical protein [Agromyces sp. GXS1127]|uniref:hypothetical protein n=1 Tax=Agromyces sp. GXS1127 TaxID=3424181 RepID=UPI003D31DFD4
MLTLDILRSLLAEAGREPKLPAEYEVSSDRIFAASGLRSLGVSLFMLTLFLMLFLAAVLWAFGPMGSTSVVAGVPMPLVMMVICFGAYMVFVWVLPLFHARMQVVADTVGARLFVVGPTPLSRRFLIITEASVLMLTSKGRLTASWPSDQVTVTSVRRFANSVGLLLAVADDRFFEIPIAHAVGGRPHRSGRMVARSGSGRFRNLLPKRSIRVVMSVSTSRGSGLAWLPSRSAV